jgi:hypothetical protein
MSKLSFARYWRYEDIPLKLFIDISQNHKYRKMVRYGFASFDNCVEKYEQIISENSKRTNSFDYQHYFGLQRKLYTQINDYYTIKAALLKLSIEIDEEIIDFLKTKGFKININTQKDYEKTIYACFRRIEGHKTRANIIKSDIDKLKKGNDSNILFEEILAILSYQLGYTVERGITLAQYNEYKKIIKQKQQRNERNKER